MELGGFEIRNASAAPGRWRGLVRPAIAMREAVTLNGSLHIRVTAGFSGLCNRNELRSH